MSKNKLFVILIAFIIIAAAGLYFSFSPHIDDLSQNLTYGHEIISDIDSQEEFDYYSYVIKASLSGFKDYTDYRVIANISDENGTVIAQDDHIFALSQTNDGKDFKLVQYESRNRKLDADHCDIAIFDMNGNMVLDAHYKFNTSDMTYEGTRETIIDIS